MAAALARDCTTTDARDSEDPTSALEVEGSPGDVLEALVAHERLLRDPVARRSRVRLRQPEPGSGPGAPRVLGVVLGTFLVTTGLALVPFSAPPAWTAGPAGVGLLLLAAALGGEGEPSGRASVAVGRDGSPRSLLEWAVTSERPAWLGTVLEQLAPCIDDAAPVRVELRRLRAEATLEATLRGGATITVSTRLAPTRRPPSVGGQPVREHLRVTVCGGSLPHFGDDAATTVEGFVLSRTPTDEGNRVLAVGPEVSLARLDVTIASPGLVRAALASLA